MAIPRPSMCGWAVYFADRKQVRIIRPIIKEPLKGSQPHWKTVKKLPIRPICPSVAGFS